MSKVTVSAGVVFFFAVLGYAPVSATADILHFAQAQPGAKKQPSPPSPPPGAQALKPMPDVTQLGEALESYAKERRDLLDALADEIKKGVATQQKADEIYDRYAGFVRETIERIGPMSDFRRDLNQAITAARNDAETFAKSTNPQVRELAKTMADIATKFETLISEANNDYARGLGVIRDLEEGRELVIAHIKTKNLSAALAAAQRYLSIVRSVIDDAEKFGKKTRETAPGS